MFEDVTFILLGYIITYALDTKQQHLGATERDDHTHGIPVATVHIVGSSYIYLHKNAH